MTESGVSKMDRREFLRAGSVLSFSAASNFGAHENSEATPMPPPPLSFQGEKSNLKITKIRMAGTAEMCMAETNDGFIIVYYQSRE